MSRIIYFDTSALAKWYINEAKSEDVERYIQEQGPVSISDLTVVEMRCLLARRRRERSIDAKMEAEIFSTFQEDVRQEFLICHQLPKGLSAGAVNLLSALSDIPLRTLDALHLAITKDLPADILATADHIMASGAKALGISVS
jgi:hypothetical protein